MTTEDILKALHNLEEAPWGGINGKPLDDRGLAKRLREYGVKPKPINFGVGVLRGYMARGSEPGDNALSDAWERYLPATSVTNVTSETDGKVVTPVTLVTPMRRAGAHD